MARRYPELAASHREFIAAQQVFFVATAASKGRINLSPKGLDSFRVLNASRVAWMNLTGSGNETAAHLEEDERMTHMFCAFCRDPLILRLYGKAQAIHRQDNRWPELSAYFEPLPGARQIILMDVDLVQTSCGFGVPLMDFQGQRELLPQWAEKKGREGLEAYWREKNALGLDGQETRIVEKSLGKEKS